MLYGKPCRGLLFFAGFSMVALVGAQAQERWLLLRPGQNTQILNTRYAGDSPRGPIIHWTFENHSSHLSRLCHAYLRDQQIPTDESIASPTTVSDGMYDLDADGNIIPSLSKMKKIQEDLLKAALLASDTILPDDGAPASAGIALASASALSPSTSASLTLPLAEPPLASAPPEPLFSQEPSATTQR